MQLKYWIKQIEDYLMAQNFNIAPYPSIKIIDKQNDLCNVFIKTGCYSYKDNCISLFINNRHIKDILRTLVHELVHHHQWLKDPERYERIKNKGSLKDNRQLRRLESEAYLLGNLYFRMFTEQFTK